MIGGFSRLKNKFKEAEYLSIYTDVAAAVKKGDFQSGYDHYLKHGKQEGRAISLDKYSEINTPVFQTKRSTLGRHASIWTWIGSHANKKQFKVLEIGSRSVVSDALWKIAIPECQYTGFDVIDGPNVDVVGDAHRLSEYFPNQKFDLVISFAVFEHLAMPWVVAEEVSKLLNDGGFVVIETHFSYSEHELPWHFFQFNSNALEVLFNEELGYELIDSGLDNPIDGKFSASADSYLSGKYVPNLFCHSSLIVRMNKGKANKNFQWIQVADRLMKTSMYPKK